MSWIGVERARRHKNTEAGKNLGLHGPCEGTGETRTKPSRPPYGGRVYIFSPALGQTRHWAGSSCSWKTEEAAAGRDGQLRAANCCQPYVFYVSAGAKQAQGFFDDCYQYLLRLLKW